MSEEQKYREMLEEFKRKQAELQKLAVDLARQRSIAGLNCEVLPVAFAETPEQVRR